MRRTLTRNGLSNYYSNKYCNNNLSVEYHNNLPPKYFEVLCVLKDCKLNTRGQWIRSRSCSRDCGKKRGSTCPAVYIASSAPSGKVITSNLGIYFARTDRSLRPNKISATHYDETHRCWEWTLLPGSNLNKNKFSEHIIIAILYQPQCEYVLSSFSKILPYIGL